VKNSNYEAAKHVIFSNKDRKKKLHKTMTMATTGNRNSEKKFTYLLFYLTTLPQMQ